MSAFLRDISRPAVIAHRGASAILAEHTFDAYVAAIEAGADGLECDVRLTRDGHLVCVHDRRVDRTSTGSGVVSEFTLPELDALDFASWHRSSGASRGLRDSADHLMRSADIPDRAGAGVLTLEMLCELVHDAGRSVRLLVETKHPTRYAGLVEKEVVRLLGRFGWAGRPGPASGLRHRPVPDAMPVTVMSFAPAALRRIRLLAPDVPSVLLIDRALPVRPDGLLPIGVPVVGPALALLRAHPGFVARAHRRHREVYVWTVDRPEDVDFVLGLGVDAIITNRPADVLRQLG